jgi:hypothetical protein
MLLGAFGLHWLAWNLFQKLTEGRKVCNVENMVQDRRKRSEMPAHPQENG